MGRDAGVEARLRRADGRRVEHVAVRPARQHAPGEAPDRGRPGQRADAGEHLEVAQGRRHAARGAQRLAREVEHPAGEHLGLRWMAVGIARLGRRDLAPLRALIEQHGEDLGARHAVDRRVVDLGHQRHVPALEPVDEVDLPERVGAVQRAREDAGDRLGDAVRRAGRRHGALADVEVDVEVGVLDPVRVIEVERDADQLPAERRQQVQPLAHQAADVLDRDLAARRRGGVVDREPRHVAVGPRRLHGQELRVQARQLVHALLVSSRCLPRRGFPARGPSRTGKAPVRDGRAATEAAGRGPGSPRAGRWPTSRRPASRASPP